MSWWSVIGFLILLVLGTLVTLYFLKPDVLHSKNEGFQSATTMSQIYLASKSDNTNMSYLEAGIVCNNLGGRLALATEVYNAAVDGTNWTIPGWIAEDTTYGYFPIINLLFFNFTTLSFFKLSINSSSFIEATAIYLSPPP